MSRKIQIGVIGSSADLAYEKSIERLAEAVGRAVAENGAVLVFGAEKDLDSLSTAACRGAKSAGGVTVGVTYEKGLHIQEENVDVVIASGSVRGGGRETTLVLSCDAVICIGGGSGTLTEVAIAYQDNIPIVGLVGTGGWTDKLVGTFLDTRNRVEVASARDPKGAVEIALHLAKKRLAKG